MCVCVVRTDETRIGGPGVYISIDEQNCGGAEEKLIHQPNFSFFLVDNDPTIPIAHEAHVTLALESYFPGYYSQLLETVSLIPPSDPPKVTPNARV